MPSAPPDPLSVALSGLDDDTRDIITEIDHLTRAADYSNVQHSNITASIIGQPVNQPPNAFLALRIPGQTARDEEWRKLIQEPMV
jgi:hypothetical protein